MMSPPLNPEAYQPCLNEDFVLRGSDGSTQFVALQAVDLGHNNEDQLSFSLLFRPRADAAPITREAQGTYRLSHPRLGEFDLFLVPIKQRRGVTLYEAVFNLLKDEAQ